MEATVLVPDVAGGTVEPHRSSLEGFLSALLICHCTWIPWTLISYLALRIIMDGFDRSTYSRICDFHKLPEAS